MAAAGTASRLLYPGGAQTGSLKQTNKQRINENCSIDWRENILLKITAGKSPALGKLVMKNIFCCR